MYGKFKSKAVKFTAWSNYSTTAPSDCCSRTELHYCV